MLSRILLLIPIYNLLYMYIERMHNYIGFIIVGVER
jgi:hypothetical protein